MLSLYKELIALRRGEPALCVGEHLGARAEADVLIYERQYRGRRLIIALNFAATAQTVTIEVAGMAILLSTYLDLHGEEVDDGIRLRPNEGVIIGLPP